MLHFNCLLFGQCVCVCVFRCVNLIYSFTGFERIKRIISGLACAALMVVGAMYESNGRFEGVATSRHASSTV